MATETIYRFNSKGGFLNKYIYKNKHLIPNKAKGLIPWWAHYPTLDQYTILGFISEKDIIFFLSPNLYEILLLRIHHNNSPLEHSKCLAVN